MEKHMLRSNEQRVLFTWDDEAGVWVATSPDIVGLVLESETLEKRGV